MKTRIILDDVLETMDENNIISFMTSISSLPDIFEFEILTHSEFLFNLLVKIATEEDVDFTVNSIKSTPMNFFILKKENNASASLHSAINNFIRSSPSDKAKKFILFLRAFNRYAHFDGLTSDMSHNKYINSWGKQYWDFSSNCIFHYEQNISAKDIKNYLNIDIKKKHINSIELLEKIESILVGPEFFGIKPVKIKLWIKKMKEILGIEKRHCYPGWVLDKTKSKNSIVKDFWPNSSAISRPERNTWAHYFENNFSWFTSS